MRSLNRNKRTMWYALYSGKKELIDEYGNRTGQFVIEYEKPRMVEANISPASGETGIAQFGENERYDKVIVFADTGIPINEYSVLWIDRIPALNADGELERGGDGEALTPHDYVVKQVAKSMNSTAYAVDKVRVGG